MAACTRRHAGDGRTQGRLPLNVEFRTPLAGISPPGFVFSERRVRHLQRLASLQKSFAERDWCLARGITSVRTVTRPMVPQSLGVSVHPTSVPQGQGRPHGRAACVISSGLCWLLLPGSSLPVLRPSVWCGGEDTTWDTCVLYHST